MKTVGNSKPLAACIVIIDTLLVLSSSRSESVSNATSCKKFPRRASYSLPSSRLISTKSCIPPRNSCTFSWRAISSGSLDEYISLRIPLFSIIIRPSSYASVVAFIAMNSLIRLRNPASLFCVPLLTSKPKCPGLHITSHRLTSLACAAS